MNVHKDETKTREITFNGIQSLSYIVSLWSLFVQLPFLRFVRVSTIIYFFNNDNIEKCFFENKNPLLQKSHFGDGKIWKVSSSLNEKISRARKIMENFSFCVFSVTAKAIKFIKFIRMYFVFYFKTRFSLAWRWMELWVFFTTPITWRQIDLFQNCTCMKLVWRSFQRF